MKTVFGVITTVLCLGSALTWAECKRSEAPDVPDGSKASKEEMITAQQGLKKYMAATEEYLNCLDEEEKAAIEVEAKATEPASEEERIERAAAHNSAYNAAVQEMEDKATEFNTQLKAFREAEAAN